MSPAAAPPGERNAARRLGTRSRRRAEPRYQANMELMASLSSALLDLSMQQQASTQAWSRLCVVACFFSHVSWIWILVKPAWALRLSTSWKFFERHLLWSPRVAENRVGWGTRLKGLKLERLRVDEAHLGVIYSSSFFPVSKLGVVNQRLPDLARYYCPLKVGRGVCCESGPCWRGSA